MIRKVILIAIAIITLVGCDKESRILVDGNWYRTILDGEIFLTFNDNNSVNLITTGINSATQPFKNASGTYVKDNGRVIFNLSYSVPEYKYGDNLTVKFTTGNFHHDGSHGDVLRVEYEMQYQDRDTGKSKFVTDRLSFIKR